MYVDVVELVIAPTAQRILNYFLEIETARFSPIHNQMTRPEICLVCEEGCGKVTSWPIRAFVLNNR